MGQNAQQKLLSGERGDVGGKFSLKARTEVMGNGIRGGSSGRVGGGESPNLNQLLKLLGPKNKGGPAPDRNVIL